MQIIILMHLQCEREREKHTTVWEKKSSKQSNIVWLADSLRDVNSAAATELKDARITRNDTLVSNTLMCKWNFWQLASLT